MERPIYHYNENRVYTTTTMATPDPVTNPGGNPHGDWLVPACATFVEPPTIPADKIAIFDEQAQTWSLSDRPDYVDPNADPRFVIWYRNSETFDSVIIGGEYRRNMVPPGQVDPLLDGRAFDDPMLSAYGFHVFDEKPEVVSVRNTNDVETKKFDIGTSTIVDRDELDILVDDVKDQKFVSVVIYRKKTGLDSKVVLVAPWCDVAQGKDVYYNGKPMTDEANQYYRYVVFRTLPEGADAIYQGEVYLKQYDEVTQTFIPRDQDSIDRDPKRAPLILGLLDTQTKEILLELTGVDKPMESHLLANQRALDVMRDPLSALTVCGMDFDAGVYQLHVLSNQNIEVGDSVVGEGIEPDCVVTEIIGVTDVAISKATTTLVIGALITFDPTARAAMVTEMYREAFRQINNMKRYADTELNKLDLE